MTKHIPRSKLFREQYTKGYNTGSYALRQEGPDCDIGITFGQYLPLTLTRGRQTVPWHSATDCKYMAHHANFELSEVGQFQGCSNET